MKKVLKYLEGEKERILEQHRSAIKSDSSKNTIISEEVISGKGGDPYEYRRDGNQYFTRKKGSNNWIKLTPETRAYNAVKKLFPQSTSTEKSNTNQKKGEESLEDYLKRTQGYLWSSDPEAAEKYGKFTASESDYYQTKARVKRAIELTPDSEIPQIFKGAGGQRLNKEIYYIKKRPEYKGKAFFVHDPRMKLIAAFDTQHNLIAYTPTIIGADKIKTETITLEMWCKASGFIYKPDAPGFAKKCVTKEGKVAKMDLDVLADIEARYLSSGIYMGGKPFYDPKYAGTSGIPNLMAIKDIKTGMSLPNSLHALYKSRVRIETDALMKSYLKSGEFGAIPEKYAKLVNRMLDTGQANLSYGCINVAPEFIQNPKVLEMAKTNPYIFVMSDEEDYYLVQMDSEQGAKYFNELQGDGTNCKSSDSIANLVGAKMA